MVYPICKVTNERCKFCSGTLSTLYYMVWECNGVKECMEALAPSYEHWKALLTTPDLDNQHGLATLAVRAAAGRGIPD